MASNEERLTLLIAKCKSTGDVDSRVDAVTKLQLEFEAGTELFDLDGLIAGLKSCLRTPNQHLSTATLSALVPLFPLLVRQGSSSPATASSSSNSSTSTSDFAILRQALNAFLSSGGVIERLGDNREKGRDKAREALLVMGSVVFKSGSAPTFRGKDTKGAETPFQIYERCLREQGLVSKSWRVREQSILTLVQLRRVNPLFPLRPFLTLLVDALEDGDGTVRECARQSVVEIFSSPGVTDAARADLKKEMARKGVRKTIVEGVLTKLFSGVGRDTPTGDNMDGTEEVVAPSNMLQGKRSAPNAPIIGRTVSHGAMTELERPTSRTGETILGDQDVTPVYVASHRDLENEFSKMLPPFEGKETEQNWLARERAVLRIRGMLKGGAHTRYPETFLAGLKSGALDSTLKALASLRTTVASSACSLYNDLATSLGPTLDPFVESLLTNLLKMAGFTKKIIATASQAVVDSLLIHTSCHPRQNVPLLWACMQEKTVQARVFAVGHVRTFVDCHALCSKHTIESTGSVDLLEKCVKKALMDPNPGVRENGRLTFWSFEAVWKERGRVLFEGLDIVARKQLQAVCPVPLAEFDIPAPSTPASRKSSVAAAIAASRAKAKQIASAPPTLRHQATSTSHAQMSRATSPPVSVKRSPSPVVNKYTSVPSLRARSPPSPRSPLVGSISPSPDRQLTIPPSPSPPSSPITESHRRRTSSPVVVHTSGRAPTHQSIPSHRILVSQIHPGQAPSFSPRTSSALRSSLYTAFGSRQGEKSRSYDTDPNESLLMAITIPLPSDNDEEDNAVNLMTFSAPWELSHASDSVNSPSPRIRQVPNSVVEDARRARAAQAESAAEQLLELVESDDSTHPSPIPPSLLPSNRTTPKPSVRTLAVPPVTPFNHSSVIMGQAALFQDSPARSGDSPSILELIEERKHQTGWWLKRVSIIGQDGTPHPEFVQCVKDLEEYIESLQNGCADIRILRKLIVLCNRNFSHDTTLPYVTSVLHFNGSAVPPPSPSPNPARVGELGAVPVLGDIWEGGVRLEKLFSALCEFLRPDKDPSILEHGLFVLWEILPQLDGHDADIIALLLQLRYAQDFNVDEGTLTIRDAQVELMNERSFTLYGLSTMNLCLKNFLTQAVPSYASQDAKLRAHAFGLITMAKFISRLPSDILEEELPKIKLTLTEAYLNPEAIVRQAATTAITAAQVILRDETHLFALLEPLPDDKKNLLTYFFEKNNARGIVGGAENRPGTSGMEKLSTEMDRLDQRISTPPRRSG